MILRNIIRNFKHFRLYTSISILGLSIGLALSIILIIFVLTELSFDKHFKDSSRIISLNTVLEENGKDREQLPICTRRALTDIPNKILGIEAATQIYASGENNLIYERTNFENITLHYTESNFFDVFNIEFLLGTKDVLDNSESLVITDKYANKIFGSITESIGKKVTINGHEYFVSAVVKELPQNTHFFFDILLPMSEDDKKIPSIEFFTFYKISKNVSLESTCKAIEEEYTLVVSEFLKGFSGEAYGITEKLTDIYLKTGSTFTLGKRSSLVFVWLLFIIANVVLLLAISNFVNLYIVQVGSRLTEIGVRKVTGASKIDLSKQFIKEITSIILISFVIGITIAFALLKNFGQLINRPYIDIHLLLNLKLILALILILVMTIIISSIYPILYLTKFKTLDLLSKRIHFSKQRLTAFIIVFQSVISIILLSFIFTVHEQTNFLKKIPIYYDPKNIMMIFLDQQSYMNSNTIKQELSKKTGVLSVSTSDHIFGGSTSGQVISLLEQDNKLRINEYRISSGICEMMKLRLVEGVFFNENSPNKTDIIINESAVKKLGLTYPVVGTVIDYQGNSEIIGVVKDFVYESSQDEVQPIVLSLPKDYGYILYIKFEDQLSAQEKNIIVKDVFSSIGLDYALTSVWAEDIYKTKFNTLEVQSNILLYASIFAILISTLGVFAIQSYTVVRRTKEVAIRRVNGASGESLFILLSSDFIKWILISGIIALPIAYLIVSNWLNNYTNRISSDLLKFIIPIFIQMIVALISSAGITIKALTRNPSKLLRQS